MTEREKIGYEITGAAESLVEDVGDFVRQFELLVLWRGEPANDLVGAVTSIRQGVGKLEKLYAQFVELEKGQ